MSQQQFQPQTGSEQQMGSSHHGDMESMQGGMESMQGQRYEGQPMQQGGQPMQQGGQPMQQSGQSMQSPMHQGQQMQQGQPMHQGQQMHGPFMQAGDQQNLTLEQALDSTVQTTLQDIVQAATVTEWCADRCIGEGPEMARCARLCRDVADLAFQSVTFISRDSVFGPELAETFAYAADDCAQECAQHSHEHCQECAIVLSKAAESTWSMLDSLGQGSQSQFQQGQGQFQQGQQF